MNIDELEAHLRDVIARVRAGETVEIAEGGETVAQITPCDDLMARLEKRFPGMQHATVSHKDLSDIVPLRLPDGVDAAAMLIEDRE